MSQELIRELYNIGEVKKVCAWFLYHEIKFVDPDYILLLGTDATKTLLGKKLSSCRGMEIDKCFSFKDRDVDTKIFATTHPAAVQRERSKEPGFKEDLQAFRRMTEGKDLYSLGDVEYRWIHEIEELEKLVDQLISDGYTDFTVDCEWATIRPGVEPLRSIQFSWAKKTGAYVDLRDTDLEEVIDVDEASELLQRLFLRDEVRIVGQNFRSDERHIRSDLGFSLIDKLYVDTILLDHSIEENRDHDLCPSLSLRWTEMGRYDSEVDSYIDENDLKVDKNGYKNIPSRVLWFYGCGDTDCTWRVWKAADKELEGNSRELFYNLIMPSQEALAEAEQTGYVIDEDRVLWFTNFFNDRAAELEDHLQGQVAARTQQKIRSLAEYVYNNYPVSQAARSLTEQPWDTEELISFGKLLRDRKDYWDDKIDPEVLYALRYVEDFLQEKFNPRSFYQIADFFFRFEDWEPLKTTDAYGGVDWEDVKDMSHEEKMAKEVRPATDQATRQFLIAQGSDLAKVLDDYKLIYGQINKVFKPLEKNEDGERVPAHKSMLYYREDDGRVRPDIRDTIVTGRRSTSNPNCQNLSHRKVSDLRKVCGEDMPHVRTIVTTPPGRVLIGADYSSAELNVMALLAGDDHLYEVLNRPDRDLHAEQAIRMYDLPYDWDSGINPKKWCKENGYSHLRDHAKGVDFGWAYRIQPYGLYVNLLKSGVDCTVDDCEEWINLLENEFPVTAEYFNEQAEAVHDPGYVVTPWGRVKHLYETDDERLNRKQGREAANFNIQCVSGSSFILTKNGQERIETLSGQKVHVYNGDEFVRAIVSKPKEKERWGLKFESSPIQTVTSPDHKFFVYQDSKRIEKKAKNIQPGDWAVGCHPELLGYDLKQVAKSTPLGGTEEMYDVAVVEEGKQEAFVCNGTLVHNSTVGDLIRAAMYLFCRIRDRKGLKSRLAPDLHDAIYAYVPGPEVKQVMEEVFPSCLGVEIPKLDASLDYDADAYIRWEKKPTPDELLERGVHEDWAHHLGKEHD